MRDCGQRHIGVCWTERFNRWWPDGAPPEYTDRSEWARLGPDGWQPRGCRGGGLVANGGSYGADGGNGSGEGMLAWMFHQRWKARP